MITPDGWVRTGDLGHVDPDGNIVVVDRLKELIKVNAFQVAPAEVEAVIVGHPAVADVAVVGAARPAQRRDAGRLRRGRCGARPRRLDAFVGRGSAPTSGPRRSTSSTSSHGPRQANSFAGSSGGGNRTAPDPTAVG